jgi:hypothetical protein
MPLPTGFQCGSTDNSYDYAIPVTLSDTVDFGVPCRALYVYHTAAATIVVRMQNGDNVTFAGITGSGGSGAHGHLLPVRAIRVLATGSSVTTVIALY